MKVFLYIFLALTGFLVQSQNLFQARLLDSLSQEPVPFAHVINLSSRLGTTTNIVGGFQLKGSVGDTIVFSIVGYKSTGWIVKEAWFEEPPALFIPQDTRLLEDVVVNRLPTEAVFKKRILDYQPEPDSFWYHGMPTPKVLNNDPLSEKQINNPLFAALQPADFLYHKFSKQEKEKRKYHRLTQNERRQRVAYQKFSREWVKEMTRLDGDKLTSFIAYCDYSIEYLEQTPQYMLLEDMLAKLSEFEKSYQG